MGQNHHCDVRVLAWDPTGLALILLFSHFLVLANSSGYLLHYLGLSLLLNRIEALLIGVPSKEKWGEGEGRQQEPEEVRKCSRAWDPDPSFLLRIGGRPG